MAEQDNEIPQNQSSENEPSVRPLSFPEERPVEPKEAREPKEPIATERPSEQREFQEPVRPDEPKESSDEKPADETPSEAPAASQTRSQDPSRRDPRHQGQNRQQRGQRGNFRNRPDNRNRPERNVQRVTRVEEEETEQENPDLQQQARQRHQYQERERDRTRNGGRQPDRSQERFPERSSLHGSNVSVIVPLYNEEQSLRELCDQLRNVLQKSAQYEILFVDDGSTDGSFRVLQDLRNRDKRIKIIRFRRNYGKSAALSVGFHHAKGDFIITMDADLQDDPNEIPNLVNELKKGFDLVSGWKKKRHDPITKTIPSKFFNFVTSVMTGVKLHDMNCGLKAYRKEVVKDLKIYGELHRYIPVLANWEGFKIGEAVVEHHARKYGKTKFGIGRFWKGFLDLLTVLFTTRYMQRPLHLFGFWGLLFFAVGFFVDLYLAGLKIFEGMSLSNRPLFMGGILLIIVGIQFVSVGLIGELIVKKRQSAEEEYSIREIWK
jgi:glycosyltransferase involved in cell wall biosynthesis